MTLLTYLEFFRITFENNEVIAIIIDASNKSIVEYNKKAGIFFGYTDFEFKNLKLTDIIALSEEELSANINQPLACDGNLIEFKYRKKDGSLANVISSVKKLNLDGKDYLLYLIQDNPNRSEDENKLAEEKEWFETIFDVANTGIIIIELDSFRIVGLNRTAQTLIGASDKEVIGKVCYETICTRADKPCTVSEGYFELRNEEKILKTIDNKTIPVLKSVKEKKIGNKTYIVESFVDLSQLKKAQADLRESEEKWKFAVESSGDGIWDWDLVSNDVYFSTLWKSMLGYNDDEIRNEISEWERLVHPDDLEKTYIDINNHIEGRTSYFTNEHRLRCKNGSYKWIWDRGKIIETTEDGKPKRMIGTHRDINEIKVAEALLKEKTEELESYFSNGLDMLGIADRKGYLYKLNPEWENVLGYNISEIAGLQYLELVHPDDMQSTKSELKNLISGKDVLNFVNRYRKADGTYSWIEWRSRVIGEKVYISARDVSKRIIAERETEELLFQIGLQKDLIEEALFEKNILIDSLENTKAELENTIKEKDKFFSILAHDLKSPFSGFLGLIKLLAEDIYDFTMRDMEKYLFAIRESAENLYKLLENLLEWSRINRGLVQFEPASTDIAFLVANNIEILRPRISIKGIQVEAVIPESINIQADFNMINAILRNLLSNAVKFTPKDGRIVITASECGNIVEISVTDSGIGIPKDMLPMLFSVGERTSRPGTEGESSTGLGLLLCKEYIEKHNGKICVESEEGKGSSFRFTIPKSIQ